MYTHTHTHTDQLTGSWSSVVITPFFLEVRFPQDCLLLLDILPLHATIKHVPARSRHLISFRSTRRRVLQLVLRKSLDWSWRFACLVTAFAVHQTLWFLYLDIYEGVDIHNFRDHRHQMNAYGASWTVLLLYGAILKHVETNTLCFRTNSLVHSQHRKSSKSLVCFLLGNLPGVWILYADVSEHSVPSS